MGQIMEFYQEFSAFQSLSNKDIVKYATKSLFYKFPSNTVVVREGDYPEEIFFVKSGRVKV
jgi:CRP-like cAMP-binding protein